MKLLPILFLALSSCASTYVREATPVPSDLAATLQLLAERDPPARTLIVELRVQVIPDSEHALALTHQESVGHWIITVDSRLPELLKEHVLIHEWAHVLQGYAGSCHETDHGPLFGVLWAEAWRAYVGEGFDDCEPEAEAGSDG